MSRALLIVTRRGGKELPQTQLEPLDARLSPDNASSRRPLIGRVAGATAVVFDPTPSVELRGASIRLGVVIGDDTGWDEPGAAPPDGTFALFRTGERSVELVADAAASRTIWYAHAANAFVASTSQRAIVALLGDFELNRRVIPWMLSSGTLGLAGGWDRRIAALRPAERVMLDRRSWHVSSTRGRVRFAPARGVARREHRARLQGAVEHACGGLAIDLSKWLVPISGGVDSRGLACMLARRHRIETVTWGLSAARDAVGNDARIAAALAEGLGVPNRYFPTDPSDEPREWLIERFLCAGEGRAAKLSGYLDGFRTWKVLHEEGWHGIIRGDEAFGSMHVRNEYEARYSANLTLLSDYFGQDAIASFDLPPQRMPVTLVRQKEETLATWRDRIYQEFRLPSLLAALTDLKAPYVEVVSPLLSHGVLAITRELPDGLRSRKRLWREVVRSLSPSVPYARHSAVQPLHAFLSEPPMLELMLAAFESPDAETALGPLLCRRLRADVKCALSAGDTDRRRSPLRSRIAAALPESAGSSVRRWTGTTLPGLHPLVFAFRALIVVRMTALLAADCRALPARLHSAANL